MQSSPRSTQRPPPSTTRKARELEDGVEMAGQTAAQHEGEAAEREQKIA